VSDFREMAESEEMRQVRAATRPSTQNCSPQQMRAERCSPWRPASRSQPQ
jgi:hypothetical protein